MVYVNANNVVNHKAKMNKVVRGEICVHSANFWVVLSVTFRYYADERD